MIPFRQSIGFRLMGITVILLTIPVLVDSFIFLAQRFHKATVHVKHHLTEEANFRSLPIGHIQQSNQEIFRILVYFMQLQQKFPTERSSTLDQAIKKMKLASRHDQIVCAARNADGHYTLVGASTDQWNDDELSSFFAAMDPFSTTARLTQSVTDLLIDPKTGSPLFITAHPVYSKDGHPLGVVAVIDDLKGAVGRLLQPNLDEYPVNFAFLLPSRAIFAPSNDQLRFKYLMPVSSSQNHPDLFVVQTNQEISHPSVAPLPPRYKRQLIEFVWQGQKYSGYIEPIHGSEFNLLAYASNKSIFLYSFYDFMVIYGIYLFIFFVGILGCYFLTRRLSAPISALSSVMVRIEEGNLQVRYQEDKFGFEINQLGEIFNHTIEALLENEKIAEEERVKKEMFSQELRLGRQVQLQLLPLTIPAYEGVELGYVFLPAIEVAGDFFDVYTKSDNKLILAIADASGKGVQACLYSLTLKNMLKIMANIEPDVYEAMRKANNLFCEDAGDSGMFATAFMAEYDHATKKLDFNGCGHNPPMLYRKKTQSIEMLKVTGVAIGFAINHEQKTAPHLYLEPGDLLVIYSDGVTEAHDIHGEMFGEERLARYIQLEAHQSAKDFISNLMEELHIFAKGMKQHDDITMVVMKVRDL